jgi:hypothetical protein
MKKILILGILLLLALAACAPPAAKVEEKKAAPVVEEKEEVKAPVVEEEPEVGRTPPMPSTLPSERHEKEPSEPATTVTTKEMDPQLRDLLKRADEKIKSIEYLYGEKNAQGNLLFRDTIQIMGQKMKILKYDEDYYVREGYYDVIYYHLGIGCCEEANRCKSHNVDNTQTVFDVDVNSLAVSKSPYQWVKDVPSSAQIVGPQTFSQRSVTFIKYSEGGNDVEMWVDDTYGVPHKVVVTESSGKEGVYQFNDMIFNSLNDRDFEPACQSKI